MDRERAELQLRRVAEAALRQAEGWHSVTGRVQRVGHALAAVGALDQVIVDALISDTTVAVAAREAAEARSAGPGRFQQQLTAAMATTAATTRATQAPATQSAATTRATQAPATQAPSGTVPEYAVPVNVPMTVDAAGVTGELFFLGYVHNSTGAALALGGTLGDKVTGKARFRGRRGRHPLGRLSFCGELVATDDLGNSYQLRFSGGGDDRDWSGMLDLDPVPSAKIRWLELSHPDGGAAVHLDLTAAGKAPEITVTAISNPPGEQYLHRLAANMLGDGYAEGYAEGLAEIVAALAAAGALSPQSPVPGQLAALAAMMASDGPADGQDRTVGLPERWRLAEWPDATPPRAYGGLAVLLPELDGISVALLGVRTRARESVVSVRATGVPEPGHGLPVWDRGLPPLWLRDADGWHATGERSAGYGDGEYTAELGVVPPLRPGDYLEILVAGQTAEASATVPVRWRIS